ncbi:MAG: NUDIX hydrolase [Anaerolineae bacterium]|nr:NUDIX hydrolase [Anaerolineae bacterium]
MDQPAITAQNGRSFPAYAVALQAIIINRNEEILMLHSPTRKQGWQIISGGLDAEETILDGTLREVGEEIGTDAKVRPLGLVHCQTFQYDPGIPYMIGTYYLLVYEGGHIVPGDDMVGSEVRWWSLAELTTEDPILHGSTHLWMLERAMDLYRLWKDEEKRPLQHDLNR